MYSDDQSGLSGYDPADIADSIATATEGQEKLKDVHKALWDFFGNASFDQNNPRAWVAFFENEDPAESEKLRKEFYEKLAAFSKMMTGYVSLAICSLVSAFPLLSHNYTQK